MSMIRTCRETIARATAGMRIERRVTRGVVEWVWELVGVGSGGESADFLFEGKSGGW